MGFRKRVGKMLIIMAALLLVVTLVPINQSVSAAEKSDDQYKIVAYYPSWGAYGRDYQVWEMDASKVSHINYAFANVCWDGRHGNSDPTGPNPQTWTCQDENGVIDVPNGSIVMGDPWIDAQKSNPGDTWDEPLRGNFKQLQKLKEEYPHLKTLISVGGWTWSNRFSDVAATQETRENFANSAVDFIRQYGFDGVDVDWEYPVSGGLPGNSRRPEDKENHVLLLQEVRDKLDEAGREDGKEYLLTIASGASPGYVENNKLDEIAEVVDWINIMTYDFNGGWQNISGHNAPLYYDPATADTELPTPEDYNVESAVEGHLQAGVPANQLVLGMPFYGRGWSNCEAASQGEYQRCSSATDGTWENGVYDFSDLEDNYINKNGYQRYWNDTAKVPFLYNAANGNFITYDDEESFRHKTDYIKTNKLAGSMFWDISGDRNKTLLTALAGQLGFQPVDGQDPDEPSLAPRNVRATEVTSTAVTLTWEEPDHGAVQYLVTYGTEEKVTDDTTVTIDHLAPGTSYTFVVSAEYEDGTRHAGQALQVTTKTEDGGDVCAAPVWQASAVYTGGDQVQHNGKLYQAKWWTTGEEPGTTGEWGVWELLGDCE
ncbi:chitinase [Evansella caseinilytica]|uniref:chitinase n=1 Tax=Evansella caseinilytica TaxID=1503961 RepID=A0A1H3GB38_9BACI|nr:glycosyl hydrolase family 18 protein [Evansella caseinilytica]SDY00491.1 chitinase [Evansella caseinilytica]